VKSFKLIILGLILAVTTFLGLFIWEMAKAPKLIEEKSEREHLIHEARAARRKLEKIRLEICELKTTEDYVRQLIIPDDAAAILTIKEISRLAQTNGLKDLEFNYIPQDSTNKLPASGGSVTLGLAQAMGLAKAKAVYVSAQFKSDFNSLLKYLKDLYGMKAVSSIEMVAITRDQAIMPLQKMSLLLALYMY